jgi:tRNA(Ile)-lysidine synthase
MESSRNASSNKPASRAAGASLPARVAEQIRAVLSPGVQLLLGLSGGIDSVALLAILRELAPAARFSLRALHVNHGISPNAGQWAQFCAALCERLHVPLAIETVRIGSLRHLGLEAAARAARYAAFNRHAADFLVLAQHRDDQAETLLLQLLRGAGLPGLAGMAPLGAGGSGPARLPVLRPLLGVPRSDIEAFARLRSLDWIEDESNADTAIDRNFLRHRVLPAIEQRFPSARELIARSAGHLAEAAELLDGLGRVDLERSDTGDGWLVSSLQSLGAARGKNALRALCRSAGAQLPATARLNELWRQLACARKDGRLCIELDSRAFMRYRGKLYLEPPARAAPAAFCATWQGEARLPLIELGGVLRFKPEEGKGLSAEKLRSAPVRVRIRQGGERLQPDAQRPRRTLKNLLQERGIPPWRRSSLPLVYCGETLVSVPGIGEESTWRAKPGERGLIATWETIPR